jgi:hypothetical protein
MESLVRVIITDIHVCTKQIETEMRMCVCANKNKISITCLYMLKMHSLLCLIWNHEL